MASAGALASLVEFLFDMFAVDLMESLWEEQMGSIRRTDEKEDERKKYRLSERRADGLRMGEKKMAAGENVFVYGGESAMW